MAKRVDSNQSEIVRTLRGVGLHVCDLHAVGHGVPDLLVTGYNRRSDTVAALLVEVKTKTGKLTPDERAFHDGYPEGGPLIVAYSAEDVLRWFGYLEGA